MGGSMQFRSINCIFVATVIAAAWIFPGASLAEQEPTLAQKYLAAYVKMHDSGNLEKNGDVADALKGYQDCRSQLMAIQKSDPDWETALVGHRIEDCQVMIERLQGIMDKSSGKTPNAAPDSATIAAIQKVQANFAAATNNAPTAAPTKSKLVYPWKENIVTTMFYIGEDSSSSSAWNEKWAQSNHGKDRWVEVKSTGGHVCYAQWEDVGPYGNDHAEYVFGPERPDGNQAGLDVSPAVAQYLGLGDEPQPAHTKWRFVDAEDVPPGAWLKYDEQAVIYTAMHAGTASGPSTTEGSK